MSSARSHTRADASDGSWTLWPTFVIVAILCLPAPALGDQWGVAIHDGASGEAVEISDVIPDSPASRAGVRTGDRVLAVQGKAVRTASEAAALVRSVAAGTPLQLRISREGWERTVALEPQIVRGRGWLGADLANAQEAGGRRVVVTEVVQGSPAANAGLKAGDVLVDLNHHRLHDAEELERTIAGMSQGDRIELTATREGWEKHISVILASRPADNRPAAAASTRVTTQPGGEPTAGPVSTNTTANADIAAAANMHYDRQEWAAAESAYREYLNRAPHESWAWERLGHALLVQARYAEALEASSKALELGSNSSGAWNNIGLSLLRLGKPAGARSAYLRAIELSPELTQAQLGLGSAYLAEGNWDKARERLEYVVERDPGNAAALESLAGTYGTLARWPDAANAYRRAMTAGAAGPDLSYALAWSLYKADQAREALAPLESLLQMQPGHVKALVLYGHVQSSLGNATAARSAWDRAARIDPLSAPPRGAADPITANAPAQAAMAAATPPPSGPMVAARPAEASPVIADGIPSPVQGGKVAAAVGDFQVKAAGASAVIGDGLREMLVTGLFGSGRFVVVERMDVPGVAAEQALSRSGMARPGSAIPPGQMDVADVLIYGAVTEFLGEAKGSSFGIGVAKLPLSLGLQSSKAHMAIDVRVVDVASGRILGAQRIVGEAGSTQTSIGASPSLRGTSIPLSLGMYSNTPMEQAIRACVEKAIAYVGQSVPGQYYHHQ